MSRFQLFCFLSLLLVTTCGGHLDGENRRKKHLPVVLWHGMGDTCCGTRGIGSIKTLLEDEFGLFVYSIGFGSPREDFTAGYFGSVNKQVETVCKRIKETPELKLGYNAIGFSQGGQFLRAVVQRCNHEGPKMKHLITLGGQHQGVMGYPGCDAMEDMSLLCKIVQRAIHFGVYLPQVSSTIIQAQYYKDPFQYEAYLKNSQFLKDINCDGGEKNSLYISNLSSLKKFVMVRFEEDTEVIPRDSAWFSWYNGTDLIPLREQAIYKEDRIGLKKLDKMQRLVFVNSPTIHMHFTTDWFTHNLVQPYLLDNKRNVMTVKK